MALPPFAPGIYWKEYEINTPTFRLTPIEKPDMSPFLVHMTGKNAILSILRGENLPNCEPGKGYLQANIPEYAQETYNARVVCFSESPTFALDFFRYRSFARWQADQRYGIGFDKANLVKYGVRPVIYVDDELVQAICFLHHQIEETERRLSGERELNSKMINTIEQIYPLLFPLLENMPQQGFMWEREWRYPSSEGFVFNHNNIRIICCPEDEEEAIREIIDEEALPYIDFIRTWQEYDDVTNYLRRQKNVWNEQAEELEQQAEVTKESAPTISNLIKQYQISVNSLNSYREIIAHFNDEVNVIDREKEQIRAEITRLEALLEDINGDEQDVEEEYDY